MINSVKRKTYARPGTLPLHLMLIPGIVLLFIFSYIPIFGNIIAFQDYNIMKQNTIISLFLGDIDWAGLKHFRKLFENPDFLIALRNTFLISFYKIAAMFFVPIIFSILLNEIRKTWLKRSIQTFIYLPYFISWVILAGILKQFLGLEGPVNYILGQVFHVEPVFFLGEKGMFRGIIVLTHMWKEFGFSTIIFLATIVGIDPTLYESAIVDGAGRFKQTWHITLPGMRSIIVLILILSLGNILNAGFDQIFNLYSVPTYEAGDIIDTLVYRLTFKLSIPQYSFGTAVGLFKNTISFIMISLSYWMAYKFANYEIF